MTTNINAKKRLTQFLVAVVILCMTVTGAAFLLKDGVKKASAATRTVNIGSASDWNTFAASYNSGDIINATLTADINASATLREIPAGVTVNLNMNGKSISWVENNTATGNARFMSESYSNSDYSNGKYWGLIKNLGTLNISGSGSIKNNHMAYDVEYKSDKTAFVQRNAAIVNNGTLTIGSNVTVEANMSFVETDTYQKHLFIHNCAIFNVGTVNSSGVINAYAMAVSGNSGPNPTSYHYAINCGIFGGNVNLTGGSVNTDSYAGGSNGTTVAGLNRASEKTHMVAISIGVCSNAATVKNTRINSKSTDWMDFQKGNAAWNSGSGISVTYSAGIMYTGTNYPVVGAAVNINAEFNHLANNTNVTVPGTNKTYGVSSGDGPANYARRSYPIVGVNSIANLMGVYDSGRYYDQNGGMFGTNSKHTGTSDNNVEKWFGYESAKYIAEDPYYDGMRNSPDNKERVAVDATSAFRRQSGQNDHETGAAGAFSNGVTGTGGSQYVIVYRYYDNNTNAANFNSVSYSYDSNKQSARAYMNVGNVKDEKGVLSSGNTLTFGGGGASRNSYYYEFVGATFEKATSSEYASRVINNNKDQMREMWGTKGQLGSSMNNATITPSADQTIVIYMNYILKQPSAVRVAAADKGVAINKFTETTEFTVPYTGAPLVPGTDFNIGIIDMGEDKELSINNTGDDNVITDVYNVKGTENNKKSVSYRYTTDATPTASSSWTQGLPKDAGKYTIEVKVVEDTTFAATGTYNRLGTTQYITCTITKADVKVTGNTARNGIYGDNLATLVPFSSFTVEGANKESVSGTWSFDQGFKTEDYVNAGTYNLNLVWTPTPGSASEKNYNSTLYSVTLVVNKRAVTVNVGNAKAGYGDKSVKYTLAFENLAACDNKKIDAWERATTGEINYNDVWVAYSEGVPMGTYPARIVSFGGASDTNNTFTYNTRNGTLEVGKKILYYTATATDRAYIPNNYNVDVKLTYKEGAIASDTVPQEITNVVGTMTNPNAGENKNVQVDVSTLQSAVGNNYQIAIDNATSLTVNIAKAIPAGVSCVADPGEITYDSTKTLANIALKATSQNVAGSWSWKDDAIVPTCDVSSYTAVFTPADTQNYESIEQAVSLNVKQADVLITIDAQTITYGDPQPAFVSKITYTGFTGEDNRSNVSTTGEVNATTTYTRGSGVGEYPITIKSDLASTNYNFITQDSTITVNKKALTITAVDQTITYGDNPPVLDGNDVVATGFYGNRDSLTSGALTGELVVSTTYNAGDNAGEYDITVSGCEAANYDITYVSGKLTVNQAVLTVKPNAVTVTYGAAVPGYRENTLYTVSGFVGNDTTASALISGVPSFSTPYKAGNSVGNYTVTPNVSQMSSVNYSFTSESNTLVVEKATPIYTGEPTATITHGQVYSEAVISSISMTNPNNNSEVEGEFALANSSAIADFTNHEENADFIFTPADDINYNSVTLNGFLAVDPKAIAGKPSINGAVMLGQELTADVSAMDPADTTVYTYQWIRNGSDIAGATDRTYTIGDADLKSNLSVRVTAKNNSGYSGNSTSDSTSEVIEKLLSVEIGQLNISDFEESYTYDGTIKSVDVTVADDYEGRIGEVTVKYNGLDVKPKAAGTYIVTVDIKAPDLQDGESYNPNYHYGPVSGLEIGRFTIKKAPLTVTVTAEDKVYDGTRTVDAATTSLVMSGIVDDDTVSIANGYRLSFDSANVGDRNIVVSGLSLTGADAGNYTIVLVGNEASITQATLTANAIGVSKVYDGSAVVDVKFTNIEGYKGGDSEATVYPADGKAYAEKSDVGTGLQMFNISYSLLGASGGNYILNLNIGTVDITPATPNVVAPEINGLVYDSARTLANVDLSAYRTSAGFWGFDSLDTVPNCSTTRYAATFYPSSNNYKTVQAAITINLIPKTVVISADNKTVQYGQKAPSFTYTVQGLTGQDKLEDIGGAGVVATTVYREGQPVGEYPITLGAHFESDDYEFTTVSGKLNVTPARLVVEAKAVDRAYNGGTDVEVNFAIVSGKYGNDMITLNPVSTTGKAATANAGVSPVSYDAPEIYGDTANYELYVTPASNVLTVNITKADLSGIIFPTEGTVQFGYDLSNVKFATEGFGDGIFAYENAKGIIPDKVGVFSNYKVIFTPTDSRNYNTQEQFVTLTVVKGKLDYVVSIAGTPQEDQTLSAYITGMPSLAHNYIHYQWYRVSDTGVATKIEDATESSYVATNNDIGYTLIVVTYFSSDAPYVFADSADIISDGYGIEVGGIMGQTSSTIEALKLSFWQRLMNWIYRLIAAITGIRFSGFGS